MTLLNYTDPIPFPAPVTSGTTVQSYTDPLGDVWVAKNGVNSGNWFRARDVLHSRWYRSAALTFPTAMTNMVLDTVTRDPYGLYVAPSFIVPVSGVYTMWFQVCPSATTTNQLTQLQLVRLSDSIQIIASNVYSAGAGALTAMCGGSEYLNAGDNIATQCRTAGTGLANNPGVTTTFATFDYLGTG